MKNTALDLIAAERARQVKEEGWSPEHDDQHTSGEIAAAAACYALPTGKRELTSTTGGFIPKHWPWMKKWWKPSHEDRIRELVKAGALLVAEIERLQRLNNVQNSGSNNPH